MKNVTYNHKGLLKPEEAAFYVAFVLLSLEFLHSHKIIYRALCTENIIIGVDGYPVLLDFNGSKLIENTNRTYTLAGVGDISYFPPERLATNSKGNAESNGYSYEYDLWSLGVFAYELVCGTLPFDSGDYENSVITARISEAEISFPHFLQDDSSKELILQLIQKDPSKRAPDSYEGLKRLNFFEKIDWEKLKTKTLIAPRIPKNLENFQKSPQSWEFSKKNKESKSESERDSDID